VRPVLRMLMRWRNNEQNRWVIEGCTFSFLVSSIFFFTYLGFFYIMEFEGLVTIKKLWLCYLVTTIFFYQKLGFPT
jgi:hypothetical protein